MRTLLPALVLAVGCPSLGGCLQLEQTITITGDGSGTQEVVLTLPDATAEELRRAAAADATGAPADLGALFTAAAVGKELGAAGLELLEHEAVREGAGRRVRLRAGFGDLAMLRRSPLCGSGAEWEIAPGPVPGSIELTFYPQGRRAWGEARQKALAVAEGGAADEVAREFLERRAAQLAGLSVTLRMRLPGRVLRHTRNMEQTGEREVTARVTAAQIRTAEDLVRRLAPRFQVVFDARGCALPLDR